MRLHPVTRGTIVRSSEEPLGKDYLTDITEKEVPMTINLTRRRLHELIKRDGAFECHYCGHPLASTWYFDTIEETETGCQPIEGARWAHVDLYISQHHGGSSELNNLVMACHKCNTRKGTKSGGEYHALLEAEADAFCIYPGELNETEQVALNALTAAGEGEDARTVARSLGWPLILMYRIIGALQAKGLLFDSGDERFEASRRPLGHWVLPE